MSEKDEDKFSEKETQQRVEAALGAAFKGLANQKKPKPSEQPKEPETKGS